MKDLSPARSEAQVPRVAEHVLRKIESLSALTKEENSVLPSDVVHAVFRALFLSREEKKEVLPYLSQEVPTTTLVVHFYITNWFQQYELMASTLLSLHKPKDPKPPPLQQYQYGAFAGAAATVVDTLALTEPTVKVEGGAGAKGEGAADEEAGGKAANASGPIRGAHPTIIRTGAHLGGDKLLKVALSV